MCVLVLSISRTTLLQRQCLLGVSPASTLWEGNDNLTQTRTILLQRQSRSLEQWSCVAKCVRSPEQWSCAKCALPVTSSKAIPHLHGGVCWGNGSREWEEYLWNSVIFFKGNCRQWRRVRNAHIVVWLLDILCCDWSWHIWGWSGHGTVPDHSFFIGRLKKVSTNQILRHHQKSENGDDKIFFYLVSRNLFNDALLERK